MESARYLIEQLAHRARTEGVTTVSWRTRSARTTGCDDVVRPLGADGRAQQTEAGVVHVVLDLRPEHDGSPRLGLTPVDGSDLRPCRRRPCARHAAIPWKSIATDWKSSTATNVCASWPRRRSVASGSRQARCRRCCPSASISTASASWCAPVEAASSMPRCRTLSWPSRSTTFDPIHHSGWSVAVTGVATEVSDPTELDSGSTCAGCPLGARRKTKSVVAISTEFVSGRRITTGSLASAAVSPRRTSST